MPEQNEYKVVIRVGDQFTEQIGTTPLEAFLKFPQMKTGIKAVISVYRNEKKWEVAYWPLRLKKLFKHPNYQKLFNHRAILALQ